MRFVDPEHTYKAQHERSLLAAELHQMKVALYKNKDRKRVERKASSQPAGRRYLCLLGAAPLNLSFMITAVQNRIDQGQRLTTTTWSARNPNRRRFTERRTGTWVINDGTLAE